MRMEERNDKLQRELMRLSRVNHKNEQFLNELEQNVRELENKIPIETLERYIPKEMLTDIKPIIDRLQFLQETRGNRAESGEEKYQE